MGLCKIRAASVNTHGRDLFYFYKYTRIYINLYIYIYIMHIYIIPFDIND